MKKYAFLLAAFLAMPALADEVKPSTLATVDFNKKHKDCLERIAVDADLAFEEAMIWQDEGGGRRARHCVAMTLFALGHADEAAHRLEKLAKSADGGSPQMRADFYVEATDMWLKANEPRKAYEAANAGLEVSRKDTGLRIARARAYAALERWDYAETDLTSVLAFEPNNTAALRYRADARRRQNKLDLAKTDIDRAVNLDIENIDTLVVRGEIYEAIRLKKAGITSVTIPAPTDQ